MLAFSAYDIKCFKQSMGINVINCESQKIGNHIGNLYKLLNDYIHKPDTKEVTDKINFEVDEISKIVDKEVEGLTDELVRLLKEI